MREQCLRVGTSPFVGLEGLLRVPRLSTEEKKQQKTVVVCEKSPEPSKLLAVQFPTG